MVDGGNCRQHIENEGKLIVEICMDVKWTDRMYVFDWVEPGHANQCNFLHQKHLRKEGEMFLDGVFGHLLQDMGQIITGYWWEERET